MDTSEMQEKQEVAETTGRKYQVTFPKRVSKKNSELRAYINLI
jgi:hypothetical protein